MDIVEIVIFVSIAGAMGWTYHQLVWRRPQLRKQARVGVGIGFAVLMAYVVVVIVEDEFLRDDIGVGPAIEGGRVERPEAGFVVTFPEAWEVQEFSDETDEGVMAEAGGSGRAIGIVGGYRNASEACVVVDATSLVREVRGWRTVEEAAPAVALNMLGTAEWAEATGTVVMLPGGRVAHIIAMGTDGAYHEGFWFTDGSRWLSLGCQAPAPPSDDRWLSIAESFEFLPVKAQKDHPADVAIARSSGFVWSSSPRY